MIMFSVHDFILNTVLGMIGHYPDFQIREYALNWYGKGKLTETDLMTIEEALMPKVEEPSEGETLVEEEVNNDDE
jgi:hypothetical protein